MSSRQRGKVGSDILLSDIIEQFDSKSCSKSITSSPVKPKGFNVKQIINETLALSKGDGPLKQEKFADVESPSTPVYDRRKKNTPPAVTPTDTISALSINERRSSIRSASKITVESIKGDIFAEKVSNEDSEVPETNEKKSAAGGFGGIRPSSLVIDPKVDKIYKLIRKSTGTLGGNGSTGAIYGELTMHSMQKCINILVEKCEMNHTSRFIDVGSGLGKPNFHAAQDPACRLSLGVELESIRWQLAIYNLYHVLPEMADCTGPDAPSKKTSTTTNFDDVKLFSNTNFICLDIDAAASTDPFTHIYMYDLGFPPPLQQSIARKFNESVHARYLVSYRPPNRVINEYGYKVELVDQVPTSMHGSHEIHTAYFYRRTNKPSSRKFSDLILRIPGRRQLKEADVDVVCDPAFYDHSRLAVGCLSELQSFVTSAALANMESERPRRERKQTVKYGSI